MVPYGSTRLLRRAGSCGDPKPGRGLADDPLERGRKGEGARIAHLVSDYIERVLALRKEPARRLHPQPLDQLSRETSRGDA